MSASITENQLKAALAWMDRLKAHPDHKMFGFMETRLTLVEWFGADSGPELVGYLEMEEDWVNFVPATDDERAALRNKHP